MNAAKIITSNATKDEKSGASKNRAMEASNSKNIRSWNFMVPACSAVEGRILPLSRVADLAFA
jgi:hypothetical protein